jgi:zinc transporter ZupT
MLTGEDMWIKPQVAQMLAAGLLAMQNMTKGMQDQTKEELTESLDVLETHLENLHRSYEVWRAPHILKRWSFVEEPPADAVLPNLIPWSATVAVAVDTFVDGFLIGLAYVAKSQAGFTMAGATTIEMTFLGLTFTAQLRSLSRQWQKTSAIVLGIPCLMPLGAYMGALLATEVEAQPAVFIGFIAFCTVALLFLVTQELLVEARENTKRWWPHLWFFGGVLVPLLVSRHTDEA